MQIIPVASGKGGVGKSLLSANLAIALGQAGKRVTLVDLDLGASNLHLVLGCQAPANGIGTFLTGNASFSDVITDTEYENVRFIPGDAEIPGLTSLKNSQRADLCSKFGKLDADYVILDLGAGTHLNILDFFLTSFHGIIVSAPTVTSTLNAYLFIKNAVFRIMDLSFKKGSPAAKYLSALKNDSARLQRLYIPKLIEAIKELDPKSAGVFTERLSRFKPRLVMNMIENPKDAERAMKIRRSCTEYLTLNLDHLGVIYRDSLQDIALSSRLPIIVYKPQAILSQAIYRIADKIIQTEDLDSQDTPEWAVESFEHAESEATADFDAKMSYIEELVGSGTLSMGELAETIKSQQFDISMLKKENTLLKSKLSQAISQGFKV